jgi:3-oxoacyl-[acyl-carrier protein] reductase
VREARFHEPAVAAAGRRADLAALDEDDVPARVALLGDDRRPQPGVAAADDAQVAVLGADQRRVAVRLVGVLVPVGVGVGVGDRLEVRAARLRIVERHGPERTEGGEYGAAMDLGITGRRAAVAAGSAGLGFGAAAALAAEGVAVAICGRDAAKVADAATRIGRGCVAITQDVGDAAGGAAFVAAATEALGSVDILVTNAGGPPPGNFASTAVDLYDPALHLNLMSVVGMCKAAVPAMQAAGWGRVVAITSLAVRQPMANLILSNVARSGATAFLKTVAGEVAADGVTVNSVQPGLHLTDRMTQLYGGPPPAHGIPAGFIGDPADFGAVVAFLCSEQAKYITGAHVHVDGGAFGGLQ